MTRNSACKYDLFKLGGELRKTNTDQKFETFVQPPFCWNVFHVIKVHFSFLIMRNFAPPASSCRVNKAWNGKTINTRHQWDVEGRGQKAVWFCCSWRDWDTALLPSFFFYFSKSLCDRFSMASKSIQILCSGQEAVPKLVWKLLIPNRRPSFFNWPCSTHSNCWNKTVPQNSPARNASLISNISSSGSRK